MTMTADILPVYGAMLAALPPPDRLAALVEATKLQRRLAVTAEAREAADDLATIAAPILEAMTDWLMEQWRTDAVLLMPAAPRGEPSRMSLKAAVEALVPILLDHHVAPVSWQEAWTDGDPVRIPVLSATQLRDGLGERADLPLLVLTMMERTGLIVPPVIREALRIAGEALASPRLHS